MAGGRIFISYRRADSQWAASRLYDTLTHVFPDDRLFMDVDSIDPGQDFVHVLEEQVGSCDVFLALIGPGWLEERGASGKRRIDDPADFVRVEIGSALARPDTVTIPVLLDGAGVPDETELPEPLRPLARRQFARLTHEGYRGEVERLVEGIRKVLDQRRNEAPGATPPASPRRTLLEMGRPLGWGAAALAVLGLMAVMAWYASRPADPSGTPDLEAFRECAVCPEMVVLPAGVFTMGSPPDEAERLEQEGPAHEVRVGRFALARTELTFDQWDACVADGGCDGYTPPDLGEGRGTVPAFNVSWEDAGAYLAWLNGKVPGDPYRLPTEAEWEYAMRAGAATAYPWGDAPDRAHANTGREICCIGAAEGPDKWVGVAPVAQFPANAFGLHDMSGNLWEWAADVYRDDYEGAPSDGSEWATGSIPGWQERHVLRGGSFEDRPSLARSATRISNDPGWRSETIGFRPARSLGR